MNSVEIEYQRLLREREDKAREDFLNSPDELPQPTVEGAPSTPSAAEGPAKSPFKVLGKGIGTAAETAATGYTHFVNGLLASSKARRHPLHPVSSPGNARA